MEASFNTLDISYKVLQEIFKKKQPIILSNIDREITCKIIEIK
jgi:hypothetical protein